MGKDRTEFEICMEEIGPEISDLILSLDQSQVEQVAIEAIREHRRLLAKAEKAYTDLKADKPSQCIVAAREAYVGAMLNSKAQMAVVAVLVDRLGYVPDVPHKLR